MGIEKSITLSKNEYDRMEEELIRLREENKQLTTDVPTLVVSNFIGSYSFRFSNEERIPNHIKREIEEIIKPFPFHADWQEERYKKEQRIRSLESKCDFMSFLVVVLFFLAVISWIILLKMN